MARKGSSDSYLNTHLDPQGFSLLIPRSSQIPGFGEIQSKDQFQEYVLQISGQDIDPDDNDFTFLRRRAWRLEGDLATCHALYIHRQIEDIVLRLPGVSAFDVGFAIEERRREYANLLALRIHVRKKLPPHQLQDLRTDDFQSVKYLLQALLECKSPDRGNGSERPNEKALDVVRGLVRRDIKLNPLSYSSFGWTASAQQRQIADSAQGTVSLREQNTSPTSHEAVPTNDDLDSWAKRVPRHPIVAIQACDLDMYIQGLKSPEDPPDPKKILEQIEQSEFEVRLTYCGIPFDVPGAEYAPNIGAHQTPGIFAEAHQQAIEIGDQELLRTGRSRVEPLVGGVSIGGKRAFAGTLGAVVWDRTDGKPCLLSNWHVLSAHVSARQGDPCYQPAIFDGGTQADIVGHLERWRLDENGDVALAKIVPHRSYANQEVLGLWHPVSSTTPPELGMIVRKWGRTSGFTHGFVDGMQLAVHIDYRDGRVRTFRNQFHIASAEIGVPFSQPGDSGALVVTSTRSAFAKKLWTILRNAELGKKFCTELEKQLNSANGKPLPRRAVRELVDEVYANRSAASLSPEAAERGGEKKAQDTRKIVENLLRELDFDIQQLKAKHDETKARGRKRAYEGVGLLFAGDTAGSPLGDFAVASNLQTLEEVLDFSLRPVFAPRSSFRKLQPEHAVVVPRPDQTASRGRGSTPGSLNQDPTGPGPQPDGEPVQTGPDSTP